jgi:DNA-binding CsgD family transcriptional regulator
MVVSSSGKESPLNLMVTPVGKEKSSGFQLESGGVSAVVFISNSQKPVNVSLEMLCQLYGLTQAEARLATALANGDSLEAMAERFTVSLHTIRTQLKSCYRKTACRRQTELVKLVLSAPDAWLQSK